MRPLTSEETSLIANVADKLGGEQKRQLLDDMKKATAELGTPDGSRVMFDIADYKRPAYRGQHSFGVEGRMLDSDGVELSVLVHADENGRLLELELIRWDSSNLLGPRWDTLSLQQ
jgi:hypothetical protein